ncbi:MAG: radical SAM protein [Methanogenium sp.]|jgi:MoaA/NifB/PqqE/SkfB family radical SAM enzyme
MFRKRISKKENYSAIHINGKTIRIAIDKTKPITELEYPEFYDVKITSFCTGKCPWCYQSSTPVGEHFENIVEKCKQFFGSLTENQRPFQIALGGGNPNQHPDFVKLLKYLSSIEIIPNYTTNGIGLTDEILKATKKYCGGVAVSCHPHLEKIWKEAVKKLVVRKIKTNLHIIVSDKKSIEYLQKIYKQYRNKVDYFVLLPYTAQGRAKEKEIDYESLTLFLKNVDSKKIAFGANFYEYLKKNRNIAQVSLYEPEIMSKYLDLSNMKIYKSSFSTS